jgi:uncharacterized protein YndB with AHSA1/START domain
VALVKRYDVDEADDAKALIIRSLTVACLLVLHEAATTAKLVSAAARATNVLMKDKIEDEPSHWPSAEAIERIVVGVDNVGRTTVGAMSESSDASVVGLTDIEYRGTYSATPAVMFAVMTDPAHMTCHFGPPGVTAPLDRITVEPHVGGRFDLTMINDANGEEYPNTGVIVEWDPPHRYLTSETGAAEGMTHETIFVDAGDGRTEMITMQRNVPAMYASAEASAGMAAWFDRLAAYVDSL